MKCLAEVECSDGTRYRILHESKDVTAEVYITDGRSNPFGWSQYRMIHRDTVAPGCTEDIEIGWLYCGEPDLKREGYTFEEVRP